MLFMEEWMNIKQLHHEGHSVRQIARLTGRARNTVRAVLQEKSPVSYQRRPMRSKLDPFKDHLAKRYEECALSARRLLTITA